MCTFADEQVYCRKTDPKIATVLKPQGTRKNQIKDEPIFKVESSSKT